jgi:PAS domain S-box-containing protein
MAAPSEATTGQAKPWSHVPGEMAARIRDFNWAATPVGAIDSWPASLRTAVDLMLRSPVFATLAVGPERLFFLNDAAARYFGDRHSGALGSRAIDVFAQKSEWVAGLYDRAFSGESVHLPEQPFDLGEPGGPEVFEAYVIPVEDTGDVIIAAAMTGFAVGTRRRADASLRESEARLNKLLNLMPAAVYTCDTEGRLTFFNRRAVESWGREPRLGDLTDRWCGSLRMWLPNGEPLPHDDCPMANAARLGKSFRNTEVVIEQPSGTRMLASVNIDPLYGEDGQLVGAINVFEDITQRRRAETASMESEARLARELADSQRLQKISSSLITEGDPATLYASILKAACSFMRADMASIQAFAPDRQRLYLLAHSGFTAKSAAFWEWVHADTGSSCGRALASDRRIVVTDMDRFDGRSEDVAAYRDSGILAVQSTPLRAQSGRIVGMISTHWRDRREFCEADFRFFDVLARLTADVLERAAIEKAMRESEERLRQFGEASQDVLWIRDAATLQWQYLTPAFEAIYGLPRDEALAGNNYRSWLELIVPDDRNNAMAAIERVRQGEHVTFDYRVRRPADGTIRWLRNTDFPIMDAQGNVALVGGVGHDLTGLRETELRLQTLMEGIPQLVWRAVDAGHWTWASPQWTEYTGQAEPESHGAGWLNAVHPDDRQRVTEIWSGAIDRGEFAAEYRVCRVSEGRYRWVQARSTPVRNAGGGIIEWLGTSTDIHEIRELQERQKILVVELQHRTRNLIGVVHSTAEKTVRASSDLAGLRSKFRDRLDALSRVQGLLSRLDERDRVTFDELIDSELAAMAIGSKRVTLRGPDGVRLRSSTVQTLAMAIHELATNALKYGALGQPAGHLTIVWRQETSRDSEEPWLHVDWRERGVEMPPLGEAPRGSGQGRELIERALPYQLRAKTSFTLGADGVHCTISIPISASNLETADG